MPNRVLCCATVLLCIILLLASVATGCHRNHNKQRRSQRNAAASTKTASIIGEKEVSRTAEGGPQKLSMSDASFSAAVESEAGNDEEKRDRLGYKESIVVVAMACCCCGALLLLLLVPRIMTWSAAAAFWKRKRNLIDQDNMKTDKNSDDQRKGTERSPPPPPPSEVHPQMQRSDQPAVADQLDAYLLKFSQLFSPSDEKKFRVAKISHLCRKIANKDPMLQGQINISADFLAALCFAFALAECEFPPTVLASVTNNCWTEDKLGDRWLRHMKMRFEQAKLYFSNNSNSGRTGQQ